jgi:hypothetical protein
MLETTTVGSLPKPDWLAEPETLWPGWRRSLTPWLWASSGAWPPGQRWFGAACSCFDYVVQEPAVHARKPLLTDRRQQDALAAAQF